MKCSGLHCDGCSSNNAIPIIGVIVLLVIGTMLVRSGHAIERGIGEVLRVLLIAACITLGLALASIGAIVTYRIRRNHRPLTQGSTHTVIGQPIDRQAIPPRMYVPSITEVIEEREHHA
jgi:hypothetical protein